MYPRVSYSFFLEITRINVCTCTCTLLSSHHRLYPHHAKLQSVRWYRAGEKIPYQDAVDYLQDAEEVNGNLQSVCIGPVLVVTYLCSD